MRKDGCSSIHPTLAVKNEKEQKNKKGQSSGKPDWPYQERRGASWKAFLNRVWERGI